MPSAPPRPPRASAWEDRLLGATDRLLEVAMAPRPARRREGGPRRGPSRPRSRPSTLASWRRVTSIEAAGIGLILLVVVVAGRPVDGHDAALEAPVVSQAAGVDAEGAVVLASGRRVHLLGLQLPTGDDPPVVRAAAFEMLGRLVRGRRVLVEYDPVLPGSVQAARPRAVGYVWVLDDDGRRQALVNLALIARGLARPVTEMGYEYQAGFVQAAAVARDREAGVWRGHSARAAGLPLAGAPPF